MSLEEALAANTAAIKEQTAFLKSLQGKGGDAAAGAGKAAAGKPAGGKPAGAKKVTLDTIKERFGAFLGIEDKKKRAKRIEQVGAMMEHFGVERATLLEEEQWKEALGYLDQLEAGETPDYMNEGDEGGDEGDALV